VVRDRDAVGVAGEVVEHLPGAPEGRLGVDHPLRLVERSQEIGEAAGLGQRLQGAGAGELALGVEGLQAGEELAAEEPGEDPDRQELIRSAADPAGGSAGGAAREAGAPRGL
jgi:hypothetical protein